MDHLSEKNTKSLVTIFAWRISRVVQDRISDEYVMLE